MNFFTLETLDLSMKTGCGPVSDVEARQAADHLSRQLTRTAPESQLWSRRMIRGLRNVSPPEAQYGDLYSPAGYEPGWKS